MHNYYLKLRGLKDIKRCNTQRRIHDEDVLQHSCAVTMLVMIVADELNSKGHGVNVELAMRKAILHDSEEIYMSDIIYPVKRHNKQIAEMLKTVTKEMGDEYYSQFDASVWRYRTLGDTSKEGVEGEIVHLCDMVELAVYCYEEIALGNKSMFDLFNKAVRIARSYRMYQDSMILKQLLDKLVLETA